MVKLYIDKNLDCSGYSADSKPDISTEFNSNSNEFKVKNKATPYDEIITLKEILNKVGKIRKKS